MNNFIFLKKRRTHIICRICCSMLVLLTIASATGCSKENSTTSEIPTKEPEPYATLEPKDPGMYVLKTYTSFEELVKRDMFTLKDGRLETYVDEEYGDFNVYTMNSMRGTFVFPDGVKTIGKYLFYFSSLQSTKIPDSVEHIETYAFSSCALKELIIPDSVTTIEECAFENIPHIYYTGPATYEPYDQYWGAKAMN